MGYVCHSLIGLIYAQMASRHANEWKSLQDDGRIHTQDFLLETKHPRKAVLATKFAALDLKIWTVAHNIYADIRRAMTEGLYDCKDELLVVDTHQNSNIHACISIAEYVDSRLVYTLRYFLELKQPTVELQTAENCGQMLNYFHAVHDKQPHRSLCVTILSILSTTWVYIAMLDKDGPNIHEYHCETLAETVVLTDMTLKSQFKTNLPTLIVNLNPITMSSPLKHTTSCFL
jgi:hypothetical protein